MFITFPPLNNSVTGDIRAVELLNVTILCYR